MIRRVVTLTVSTIVMLTLLAVPASAVKHPVNDTGVHMTVVKTRGPLGADANGVAQIKLVNTASTDSHCVLSAFWGNSLQERFAGWVDGGLHIKGWFTRLAHPGVWMFTSVCSNPYTVTRQIITIGAVTAPVSKPRLWGKFICNADGLWWNVIYDNELSTTPTDYYVEMGDRRYSEEHVPGSYAWGTLVPHVRPDTPVKTVAVGADGRKHTWTSVRHHPCNP